MSCRTISRFLLVCSILLCAAIAMAQIAPTTVFQLDGQTAKDNAWPNCTYIDKPVANPPTETGGQVCDYWNLLNGTGTEGSFQGGNGDHWDVRSFVSGASSSNAFTQGSKDIQDPSSWHYSGNPTPDKDTITNGYNAAYTRVNGSDTDTLLIIGAERFSVNGDANIGIWFFQQDVHPIPGGSTFTGNHVKNDVFMVSSFTGGGVTPTISVYIWDPACTGADSGYKSNDPPSSTNLSCAGKNMRYVSSFVSLCSDLQTGGSNVSSSAACAVTNQVPITTNWPSPAKGGGTQLPAQTFFTGGIDLTYVFQHILGVSSAPCFSSFLFDTRTSQSLTATVKDFLSGGFPECHVSVTKTYTCNGFNADSTFNYSYTGTVTNDGGGTLFNVSVKDSPTDGSPVTYSCGNLTKGQSKTFPSASCPQPSGTTNAVTTTTHPATNVADASAQTSASGGTAITASTGSISSTDAKDQNGNSVCNPQVGIDVSKTCVTGFQVSGSNVVVRVDYTGSVKNTGTLNLTSWQVTDKDDAGNTAGGPFNSAASLAPGASICYTNNSAACPDLSSPQSGLSTTPTGAANYFPTGADAFGLTLGRISFTDTVTATGKASNGSNVGPATKSATCVICPFGSCPAQQ
jgi:hypothetical protein